MTWDKITKALASVGGVVIALLGGWDPMLKTQFYFMAIDYLTGIMAGLIGKSPKTETGHIDSQIAWKGLFKKVGEVLAIIVSVRLDEIAMSAMGYSTPFFRYGTMLYIIATEGISILENLGAMGVPLPAFIKKALEQLQHKADTTNLLEDVDKNNENKE